MEGQELLTSLAKSFGDPWLRSSVTEVGLPPTLGLPLLPLTWLPLTRWVHFCQVPRNRATPGFDLSKVACRIKGNTCFHRGSRLAVFGHL